MSLTIKPVVQQSGQQHIIYNSEAAESISAPISAKWLDIEFWRDHATLEPVGLGRGGAWFIKSTQGEYVLRHYHRGGMAARILNDQYLWTGLQQTRAWREWQLLAHMRGLGLPVPDPVIAGVHRHGLFYRADILTERLPATAPLSHYLSRQVLELEQWQVIGQTIARFHQQQIYHADLNAHNILLNNKGEIYLIDFDKGRLRSGQDWKEKNLQRLNRSLVKIKTLDAGIQFTEQDWQALLRGYQTIS